MAPCLRIYLFRITRKDTPNGFFLCGRSLGIHGFSHAKHLESHNGVIPDIRDSFFGINGERTAKGFLLCSLCCGIVWWQGHGKQCFCLRSDGYLRSKVKRTVALVKCNPANVSRYSAFILSLFAHHLPFHIKAEELDNKLHMNDYQNAAIIG